MDVIKFIVITASRTSTTHSCPAEFRLLECHPVFPNTVHVMKYVRKAAPVTGKRETDSQVEGLLFFTAQRAAPTVLTGKT